MSTFYAAFPDSAQAQLMLRHLLGDGVALDDISLVTKKPGGLTPFEQATTGDASYFVGRSDDPAHSLIDERSQGADYEAVEMIRVGAGISSSDTGINVDSVDQMDDSQSAAEDMTWPRDDASFASHEMDDLNRAVRTGFPSPVALIDDFEDRLTEPDRTPEPISVPGVGVVMGGGDLATAAFDWADSDGKADNSALLVYLQDEGVPPAMASDFLSHFSNGGAIVAVALLPQTNEEALEDIAERLGAVSTGWYGAPRF